MIWTELQNLEKYLCEGEGQKQPVVFDSSDGTALTDMFL